MPAEQIHTAGSSQAALPRPGPVFELRNTIPVPLESEGDRFPPDHWAKLATYLIDVLRTLNLRTDDPAVDVRWFQKAVRREPKRWWEYPS